MRAPDRLALPEQVIKELRTCKAYLIDVKPLAAAAATGSADASASDPPGDNGSRRPAASGPGGVYDGGFDGGYGMEPADLKPRRFGVIGGESLMVPYEGAYASDSDDSADSGTGGGASGRGRFKDGLTMTILGSREQYCVHPEVSQSATKNEVRAMCRP